MLIQMLENEWKEGVRSAKLTVPKRLHGDEKAVLPNLKLDKFEPR
jgi:hypothetical protein